MIDPPWQPAIVYAPRGIATLWEPAEHAPDALADLLGRRRAMLLAALPATTQELARAHAASPAGVSEHLSVLRRAGLVAGRREGRTVRYARTPPATRLCVQRPDASLLRNVDCSTNCRRAGLGGRGGHAAARLRRRDRGGPLPRDPRWGLIVDGTWLLGLVQGWVVLVLALVLVNVITIPGAGAIHVAQRLWHAEPEPRAALRPARLESAR